jgi:membrane-bound ClpP family serine protease
MSALGLIILLCAAGLLLLIAEIFLPSHGLLTVAGLALLGIAVYRTFVAYGEQAGLLAILACFILLPTMGYFAVKYWRQTPIGRKIVPPNPVLTSADTGVPIDELNRLVGKRGKTVSPLHPVGICDFDGKRISCVSQLGTVESGVEVVGIQIQSGNLSVKPVET